MGRLAREPGYNSASALYINNAYGQGLAEQFGDTFEAEGGAVQELVPHEGVQPIASHARGFGHLSKTMYKYKQ